jgi:putative transposase
MKYRPSYPHKPFASREEAEAWVKEFVQWYNEEHLHSGIGFVAPAARHEGRADAVLKHRRRVYAEARQKNPGRWSGPERAWKAPAVVFLNPTKETRTQELNHAIAA